jgi:hypothetical protein
VEEWLRVENQRGIDAGKGPLSERIQDGKRVPILKIGEDNMRGKL